MDGIETDSTEPAPPPYSQEELDSKVELARQVSILDTQADRHGHDPAYISHSQQHQDLQPYQPPSDPTAHLIPPQPASNPPRRARRPLPVPNAPTTISIPPPPPSLPSLSSNQSGHTNRYQTATSRPTKEQPSWYAEAGLGSVQPTSSSSSSSFQPSQAASAQEHSLVEAPTIPDDERDSPLGHELPPFEPVGPSLEGPAYSISDNALNAPETSSPATEHPPALQEYTPAPRRPTPRSRRDSQPGPVARARSPYNTRNMTFNSPPPHAPPMMGYNPRPEQISRPSAATRVLNASAFYNSSVSSVIPQHQMHSNPPDQRFGAPPLPQRPNSSSPAFQYQYPPSSVQQQWNGGNPNSGFDQRHSAPYSTPSFNPTPPPNFGGQQPYNPTGYATWHN